MNKTVENGFPINTFSLEKDMNEYESHHTLK